MQVRFCWCHYPAAPTTDNATDNPIPVKAHMYGDVSSKNLNSGFFFLIEDIPKTRKFIMV